MCAHVADVAEGEGLLAGVAVVAGAVARVGVGVAGHKFADEEVGGPDHCCGWDEDGVRLMRVMRLCEMKSSSRLMRWCEMKSRSKVYVSVEMIGVEEGDCWGYLI